MTFSTVASTALPPGPQIQVVSTATADGTLYVTTVFDSGGRPVATSSAMVSAASSAGVFSSIIGNDASLDIAGQSAAQGGAVVVTGGTSSTSANAGGAVSLVGGTPGATGIGGAVAMTGGAGLGGAAGGAATVTAGAGQGTGAGAIAGVVGGASGAGATGNGGVARIIGGAAASTDGSGGNVLATSGASTGTGAGSSVILTAGAVSTGAAGGVITRGISVKNQPAPTALSGAATLTAAQVISRILVSTTNVGAGVAYQMPTGTNLQNALPADFTTNDDSLDFHIINASSNAGDVITLTVNTDVTIVGQGSVQPNNAATSSASSMWRLRRTAAHVFVVYRIA